MFISNHTMIRVSAIAACCTVVTMFVLFLVTGVGQDPLQYVHPVDEYLRLLTANPQTLKVAIGLDNVFIAFYSAAFVGMAVRAKALGGPSLLINVAFTGIAALTVLDVLENMHFLSMIAQAQTGLAPSAAEIELQVWESLVKFHVSYVALFLMGFALPRRTSAEKLLSNVSFFVQLPVGVAIYIAPLALAVPLVMVRFTYFAVALALVAYTANPDDSGSGGGSARG